MKIPPAYLAAAYLTLDEHWDRAVPVNTIAIANAMGIEVVLHHPFDVKDTYDPDTKKIFLSEEHPRQQLRFEVAFGIGLALLGKGARTVKGDFELALKVYHFAEEVSIPREPLKVMVDYRKQEFEELCETFDIIPRAMSVRLKNLGYT